MQRVAQLLLTLGLGATFATPAFAQRVPFERTFDMTGAAKLDVSTIRGKIDITSGDAGRVVVHGTVTARVGFDVPVNALEIARKIAAHPPIEQEGAAIRLRPPSAVEDQRAVTISYEVRVPVDTEVMTLSDSGETSIRGVSGAVTVRTQSAAIDLSGLGSTAAVTTGSGAVTIDGVGGALIVTTSSSSCTARDLKGSAHVRTGSGAVNLDLSGSGNVDVETDSSAIVVRGARGSLSAVTGSGLVNVQGTPGGAWNASTSSSAIVMWIESSDFDVDAMSGSSSVKMEGATVQGSVTKERMNGKVGRGGSLVTAKTRSGSIRITVGRH
jgi:hypothetical protein